MAINFFISIRVKIISFFIKLNEDIIFYPKLQKFYNKNFYKKKLNLVIDVGSNKGQSIRFFKKINSNVRIIGFEPDRKLFSKLKKKSFKNCKLYNLGCSDVNDYLVFKENILSESSTFEMVNDDSKWLKKKEKILGLSSYEMIINSYKIKVVKLSDFLISNLEDHKIDVIKIDVEGHELNVLKGLFPTKLQIKFIQYEEHYDDLYEDNEMKIKHFLVDNGFEFFHKVKHGFGEIYDVIYKNKAL